MYSGIEQSSLRPQLEALPAGPRGLLRGRAGGAGACGRRGPGGGRAPRGGAGPRSQGPDHGLGQAGAPPEHARVRASARADLTERENQEEPQNAFPRCTEIDEQSCTVLRLQFLTMLL